MSPALADPLSQAPFITATLTYSEPNPKDPEKPYNYISRPPEGQPRRNTLQVEHQVAIRNIRGLDQHASLDTTGFQFVFEPSIAKVGDGKQSRKEWDDERWITGEYYKESEELIKKVTGATRVVFFDHTIRKQDNTGLIEDLPESRQPVQLVHVDQTDQAGINRVHRHVPEDAERLLQGRAQIINLWRPLRGPVKDRPLALGDFRMLDQEKDLYPSELRYPDRSGETLGIRFSERHTFYFLEGAQPDEAVLIKCWDTDKTPGNATLTPHTAFADPRFPPGSVPERQSIELRALVFYER